MRLVLVLVFCVGCHPALVNMPPQPVADTPTMVKWRQAVTQGLNDHERRLKEIENARPH